MNYANAPLEPEQGFEPYKLSALDNQPYGCIKLDKAGRVLEMNVAASAVLGVRPSDAMGKCFFTSVAPCTGNAAFHGRFNAAMAGNGVLNKVLDHRFLQSNAPLAIRSIDVRVHMFSSVDAAGRPVVWVITRKKVSAPSRVFSFATQGAHIDNTALRVQKSVNRPRICDISSDFDVLI